MRRKAELSAAAGEFSCQCGLNENLRYHVEVLATPDRLEDVVAGVTRMTRAFWQSTTSLPGRCKNGRNRA
jgi:hypothetical protein